MRMTEGCATRSIRHARHKGGAPTHTTTPTPNASQPACACVGACACDGTSASAIFAAAADTHRGRPLPHGGMPVRSATLITPHDRLVPHEGPGRDARELARRAACAHNYDVVPWDTAQREHHFPVEMNSRHRWMPGVDTRR
jgi:hypothetical protein